jgi:hypothetical protein
VRRSILRHGRRARVFDLVSITSTVGPPSFAFFAKSSPELVEGAGVGNACTTGLVTGPRCNKSHSTGSIAAHPFDSAQGKLLQKTQEWGTLGSPQIPQQ